MTTRQREGMFDNTFKRTIDWGLGMIIDSKRYGVENVPYGYGRYASDGTFGHGGSQSSVGFADPARQLAVVCYFNGMPGEAAHQRRLRAVLDAALRGFGAGGGLRRENGELRRLTIYCQSACPQGSFA